MSKIKSTIWFDFLPTEIIFQIFDYLSNNDIIYAFFNTSQRLNNLLLQNQSYVTYLELPTRNFSIWKNILSIIGLRIECLVINSISLSFPLSYFPNIKSIIISLPFNLSNEELRLILESKQFANIQSFKIKENKFFSDGLYYDRLTYPSFILNKIFNDKNSLKIFEYLLTTSPLKLTSIDNFQTNFNLHSLTLTLTYFHMIFNLIKYTPNLIYLNVQAAMSDGRTISTDNMNIKLKQLHLTLYMDSDRISFCDGQHNTIKRFSSFLNFLEQFSSSLNCLSLNLSRLNIETADNFACNSFKFQQFLESMKELKQFHLYNRLFLCPMNNDMILSQFKNQYWLTQNLSFGMHRNYFYTLPFQFNHFYEFSEGFNGVKSNKPEILINNPRIWYNVKSIELPFTDKYNKNFIRELKMKMPKLTSIKFANIQSWSTCQTTDLHTTTDKIDLRLDNMTTVQMAYGTIEDKKEWFICSLPNLKHLSFSHGKLPSINNQLCCILTL
jgi:hypothetical protein